MLIRMSLRARLVLGVIVLAALGLAVADVATYTSLRSFLFDRTDNALDAAHPGVEHALFQDEPESSPRGRIGPLASAAPGDYVQLRTLEGRIVGSQMNPQF